MADNRVKGKKKRKALFSPPSSSSFSGGSDYRKLDNNNSSDTDPSCETSRPQKRKSRYENDPNYPEPRAKRTVRSSSGNGINIREDEVAAGEVGCSDGGAANSKKKRITRTRRRRRKRNRTHYSTRSSTKIKSQCSSSFSSSQKRTILSWLIESRIVQQNEQILYKNETGEVLLEGVLTGDGIWCSCCNNVISVSDFQLHAGEEPNRPYDRVFVAETGVSLLTCQVEAWDQQGIPELEGFHLVELKDDVQDRNDDACVICADGGNLICCDKCPSTYHISCLQMEVKLFTLVII